MHYEHSISRTCKTLAPSNYFLCKYLTKPKPLGFELNLDADHEKASALHPKQ